VRRAYPYYFGEAYLRISVLWRIRFVKYNRRLKNILGYTAEDTTATFVITEVALVTWILELIQITRLLTTFVQINLSQL
jgi:hypothetical protein